MISWYSVVVFQNNRSGSLVAATKNSQRVSRHGGTHPRSNSLSYFTINPSNLLIPLYENISTTLQQLTILPLYSLFYHL